VAVAAAVAADFVWVPASSYTSFTVLDKKSFEVCCCHLKRKKICLKLQIKYPWYSFALNM
jgi:hypothetical protein